MMGWKRGTYFLPEGVDVPLWELSPHCRGRLRLDRLSRSWVLDEVFSLFVVPIHLDGARVSSNIAVY